MQSKLSQDQIEKVSERFHDHPLLIACRQAFECYEADMQRLLFAPEEIFLETAIIVDDLLAEPNRAEKYVGSLWNALKVKIRRWEPEAPQDDLNKICGAILYVVAAVLCQHHHRFFNEEVKDLILTVARSSMPADSTEEARIIRELSRSADGLEEWLSAYIQNSDLLSEEIMDSTNHQTEMENKEKILKMLGKSGIAVAGDFIVGDKVQNKVEKVESGGIGFQITTGKETPLTIQDKDIKAAIGELLIVKDANDQLLFRNKKQWWAVFRVLLCYCNYPSQMTSFETKMKELEVAKVDGKRDLSYESLSAAAKEVPMMATCKPDTWHTLKDKSDNYLQQYVVAEFLMQKLGIKS